MPSNSTLSTSSIIFTTLQNCNVMPIKSIDTNIPFLERLAINAKKDCYDNTQFNFDEEACIFASSNTSKTKSNIEMKKYKRKTTEVEDLENTFDNTFEYSIIDSKKQSIFLNLYIYNKLIINHSIFIFISELMQEKTNSLISNKSQDEDSEYLKSELKKIFDMFSAEGEYIIFFTFYLSYKSNKLIIKFIKIYNCQKIAPEWMS